MSQVALAGYDCSGVALQGYGPPCDDARKKSRPRPKLSGWITQRWWNTLHVMADHIHQTHDILHVHADDYGQISNIIRAQKDDHTSIKQTINITHNEKTIQYEAVLHAYHDDNDIINAILHITEPHVHQTSTTITPKRDIDTIAAIYLHLRKRYLGV